ncbi:MAG TPA: hypothetical protein VHI13_06285 [Candidatus Kapabacteria bacterium]|nr:hypothetical protein [Candidatus Kapabacteria bacterium]
MNIGTSAYRLCAALLCCLPLLSCNENATGNGRLSGTLYVEVNLVDQDGNLLTDRGDVKVSIDGSDRTAITSPSGLCRFEDLPAGTYDFTLTKPLFSNMKVYGFQFVGGGTAYLRDLYLTGLPDYAFNEFNATIDTASSLGADFVRITGTASTPAPATANRHIRVYMDTSAALTSRQSGHIGADVVTLQAGDQTFNGTVALSGLRSAGVRKGQVVYVLAYPMAYRAVGYYEPAAQEWHETNLGYFHSPVVSFTMP